MEAPPDYLSELMVRPNSVLLERNRSRTLWLGAWRLVAGALRRRTLLDIVGLLEPNDDLSRRALDSLLIADIATGQKSSARSARSTAST